MENELVLCAVDRTETGTKVLDAAKATGVPVLMAHVANSLLDSTIPAFIADPETERVVAHGPTGPQLLSLARTRQVSLIVVGTRGKLLNSVARYVAKRAHCPVLVVGPKADPAAEPITRPAFDRGLVRSAATPVLIASSG
jgi:nucleotide-binding universal stress UspA family protein